MKTKTEERGNEMVMKMNKLIASMVIVVAGVVLASDSEMTAEGLRHAVKSAIGEAGASISASKIPSNAAVAILPISGDGDGWLAGQLKIALTDAGKTCVEGKEDPMWDFILKEITWDVRKEDILDAATLDKFGRIKSAQYLMYGCVRRLAVSERHELIEIELHASCIATKQHVWGGSFVGRYNAPGADPKGVVDIPSDVRVALIDGIRAKMSESLAKSPKLGAVKRVAILPVVGDVDQYAEGLFRDVLSMSSVTPVNLDVSTRAEARFALREGSGKADAIAYGVLRDLSVKVVETKATGEKTCAATMELQLWIENGLTREIVWSDTVQLVKEFETGARGWWNKLCAFVPWFADHPTAIVWLPLAVLIGLIVLIMLLRAMTRVR